MGEDSTDHTSLFTKDLPIEMFLEHISIGAPNNRLIMA